MSDTDRDNFEIRVLVLAPSVKDAELTRGILAGAGIACVICADPVQVCEQLTAGAGAVLIAEEAIHSGNDCLADWLGRQPLWSDIPVLILARAGANSTAVAWAMENLGNVTVLERPMRESALVSTVRAALRARHRQYQLLEQLAQRERLAEQLQIAMAAANAGSWQINVTTGEFSASDRAIELHGLPPGTRLNHERALACVHPEDRESIDAALRMTVGSGKPFRHEHRVPQPDGSVRWLVSQAERRVEGDQTFVIGLVQDVTERRHAEELLGASQHGLRLTLEAASTGLWEWDVATNVVTWSPECYPIHKMKDGEFDGTAAAFDRLLHPEDRSRVWATVRAAVEGRTKYACEFRIVCPDGEVRWVSNTGQAVYDDGRPARMVGTVTDITSRKQNEEHIRLAAEVAGLGVLAIDYGTDLFTPDATAAGLFGLEAGVAVSLSQLRDRYHPDDRAEILRRMQQCCDPTGDGRFAMEHRVVHADGTTKWLSVQKQIVFAVDGGIRRPVSGVLAAVDITARKEAEAALHQSQERLAFVRRSSGVGFWYCDLPFDVLHWDELVKSHFHLPPDAVVTIHTFYDRIHPDDREPTRQAIERSITEKSPYKVEYRTVDPESSAVKWVRAIGRTYYAADDTPNRFDGVTLDVSEEKRFEAELRDGEQRMRLATEATGVGIWQWNVATGKIRWDAQMFRIYGLSPTDDGTLDYATWRGAVFADDLPRQEEVLQETARTAGHSSREFRIRRANDGELRILQSVETARTNVDGQVEWVVGTNLDITEHKQADERLRQSEARLRRVFESNVIGMIRWDLDRSLILDANDEFLRMTGYTREDLTNGTLNFRSLTPPEWTQRNEAGIQSLRKDGFAAAYEKEYFRKDGSRVPLIIAGTRFLDSPLEGMSFLIDISDRKRVEETLRRSEARLDGILRRSPAGIVQTDAAGCMTLVNPRWCEMLGYSETELIGRNILEITHASFVDETAAAFDRLAAGGPDFQIEKAYCRKDGSVLRAQCNVAALRSPTGEFLGLIAVVLDIAERLRGEEELRRLAAQLSEADRRKDEFLATLAHELRNPLAAVRSAVQILCKLDSAAQPTFAGMHDVIDRQSAHMIRLIDDLMDVSRVTRGKVALKRQTVDLVDVVREAIGTACAAYADRNHDVKLILPEQPVKVEGDPLRLAQIVANLISNSCRYTDADGTIQVSVSCEGERGEQAVVRVKDNGIGISASMLTRVFETFTQADTSLDRVASRAGGLGIGLALVKSLVEQHGGSVEACSEGLGKGSEFVVRLPALPSDEKKAPAHQPTAVPPAIDDRHANTSRPLRSLATPRVGLSEPPRILVVDDNVDAAQCVALMLRSDGYQAHTAHDGQDAVEQAMLLEPDIVLLDIGLPRLNGYDACRVIREKLRRQRPVMIAVTGWGQESDRQKSQEAGFDGHLVKPVDYDTLAKLLPELMAKRNSSTKSAADDAVQR